jgi:hypothetical protein
LIIISNQDIKDFQKEKYSKWVVKNLRSNKKDWDHIPIVLLSARKYALTIDDNFIFDLINFPGYAVTAVKRPELLNYT